MELLFGYLSSFTWVDILRNLVDIVIVAYLLYFLYNLFENTNSISVVKGFVIILFIYVVSSFLELKTIAWIFRYVVNYIFVILVVLFQPEIRKILLRLGQTGVRNLGRTTKESIDEITKAVVFMSANKMGGLIIIENKTGLKQLLEDSIQINAGVKAEMIISIFYKGNIMHDGGIIIKGDRIIAGKVIIPSLQIDTLEKIKSNLGTRHRAGIAVTVDNDAVSIIISEETGFYSIAHNGKLTYNLTREKFERRVNEILG